MDANLQTPFLLSEAHHFALDDAPGLTFDGARRVLRLASTRTRVFVEDDAAARARLDLAPGAVDRLGTSARWDAASQRILASGVSSGELPIYTAAPLSPVTDLAVGADDVLYLAVGGGLVLQDLRGRWDTTDPVTAAGFHAWRIAAAPGGGIYALDPGLRRVARLTGLPLRRREATAGATVFRPRPEDGDPPTVRLLPLASLPATERPVAIACSPAGRVVVLTWVSGGDARLYQLDEHQRFGAPQILDSVRFPYSLAFAAEDRVAVLVATAGAPLNEALCFPLLPVGKPGAAPARALAAGDIHPLRDHAGGPFLHGLALPARYLSLTGPLPLHRLVWPSYAAAADTGNVTLLDAGSTRAVWHRLYLEASIPPHCGVRVSLAATDTPEAPPPSQVDAWHEHHFGAVPPSATPDVPRGAWMRERSEIPFHPGLLPCASRPGEAGLFSVLIQRAGRRVRALTGRHLWVRLSLIGDGRSTPEVAAVRAYASRRSYAEQLPELYRETLSGPERDERGDSTRADFLDRFLGLFESVLTPLEDRVARADLVTDPRTTPAEALEWLAAWIGFGFATGLPEDRRRAMLARAPELYRRRGTLDGLRLALDLATGGAVTTGAVRVLEDFRLRRTFATVLGADLADENDPVLAGFAVSGNSFVGDTLILGEEERKEFLALFGEGIERDARERAAVAALFDRLAHRATVLVHQETGAQDLGLIRAIVELETPAHVEIKVVTASQRFLVGISALVGEDTFLGIKPQPGVIRVDQSAVGRQDRVQHLASLDPRLGRVVADPVAALAAPAPVAVGAAFTLDAGASRAGVGRRLTRYRFTLVS